MSPRCLRGLWSKRSASVKAYKPSTRYVPPQPACRMWSALHPSPTAPPGTICWCSAGTGTFRRCLGGARSLRCSAQDRLGSGHPCCWLLWRRLGIKCSLCLPRRLVQHANISTNISTNIFSISAISVCWPALDARCQLSRRVKVQACNTATTSGVCACRYSSGIAGVCRIGQGAGVLQQPRQIAH